MNTRKHLSIFFGISKIAYAICIAATIIGFVSMLTGETPLPFVLSLCGCFVFYGEMVFLSLIIDFYDSIVTPYKNQK